MTWPESPEPVRATVCGLPALSVKVNAAVRLPEPEGVKVTLIVHELFAVTTPPQVVPVCAKSLALAPVNVTLVSTRVWLPVLVKVTLWAALVVPWLWLPKSQRRGIEAGRGPVGGSCNAHQLLCSGNIAAIVRDN